MPLSFPISPTVGTIYTDDNSVVWQYDGVKWNIVTGSTKKLFNGVKVAITTFFSLTTTETAIAWQSEDYDTTDYFNIVTPTRITIPATGYYTIHAVLFTNTVGAGYLVTIKVNGVTVLGQSQLNANQSAEFEQTRLFNQNDYIEIYANDSTSTGSFINGTYFEVILAGLSFGTGASSYQAFSGVKTILTSNYSTNTTPSTLDWDTTEFDTNANALALTYWNYLVPGRVTIKTPGYYQLNTYVKVNETGGIYTVTILKNGVTTITTTLLQPNETARLEQVYQLTTDDYLEIYVSDDLGSGSISTDSYLEIIRMGF